MSYKQYHLCKCDVRQTCIIKNGKRHMYMTDGKRWFYAMSRDCPDIKKVWQLPVKWVEGLKIHV